MNYSISSYMYKSQKSDISDLREYKIIFISFNAQFNSPHTLLTHFLHVCSLLSLENGLKFIYLALSLPQLSFRLFVKIYLRVTPNSTYSSNLQYLSLEI
jgi:hypothetical protein